MRESRARWLIVTGDDFGLSVGVNRGIADACRDGVLTSTSLMVARPAAADAAQRARGLPGLSVGLHLELEIDGNPRAAVDAQLGRFRELMGRPPTHLDSHRDRHRDPRMLPDVLEAARALAVPLRHHAPIRCHTSFYAQWHGETHLEQVSTESMLGVLETEIAAGVTELVCHPGYVDGELDSSYRRERQAEVATLCDRRVREALQRLRIGLIGFRDLPRLLGRAPPLASAEPWQP